MSLARSREYLRSLGDSTRRHEPRTNTCATLSRLNSSSREEGLSRELAEGEAGEVRELTTRAGCTAELLSLRSSRELTGTCAHLRDY
ncbi:hypothetical protein E2C01_016724 [Portunus trituberculatus]|uniref:Uncharacterized protein n=1 Tax=Portunus trituberculatus TaxID=210409 RepID=A0A5B7DQZ5_PORTR|nr:hypothetical protein [Portunus trituberculatus]